MDNIDEIYRCTVPLSATSQLIMDWQRLTVDATYRTNDSDTFKQLEKEAKLAEICDAMGSLNLQSNS